MEISGAGDRAGLVLWPSRPSSKAPRNLKLAQGPLRHLPVANAGLATLRKPPHPAQQSSSPVKSKSIVEADVVLLRKVASGEGLQSLHQKDDGIEILKGISKERLHCRKRTVTLLDQGCHWTFGHSVPAYIL